MIDFAPVTIPVLYRTFAFALIVVGVASVIATNVAATRSFFIIVISLLKIKIYFVVVFGADIINTISLLKNENYFWALKKSLSLR